MTAAAIKAVFYLVGFYLIAIMAIVAGVVILAATPRKKVTAGTASR